MTDASHAVYEVLPHPRGGWKIQRVGSLRPARLAKTKDQAIDQVRKMIRRRPRLEVILYRADGTVERRLGEDERPPRGPGRRHAAPPPGRGLPEDQTRP